MTVKDTLHQLVDALPDEQVEDALEYLHWLMAETDTLTDEGLKAHESGKAELARGEYVTLDDIRRTRLT